MHTMAWCRVKALLLSPSTCNMSQAVVILKFSYPRETHLHGTSPLTSIPRKDIIIGIGIGIGIGYREAGPTNHHSRWRAGYTT